ncbi:copper resistance protein B [Sphingomonas sp. CL5.1]|nr:copper resistance protein B [Sphingomonas sp. CL5.1]
MDHAGHDGMTMSAAPAPPLCPPEHAAMGHCKPAAPPAPMPATGDPQCPPEHAAMGHCKPDPHAGHAMPQAMGGGTALPAGNAPPPPATAADYADRFWGADAMAASRAALRREHGGMAFSQVMIDLAEARIGAGPDGYRWSGEGWFGGDVNRLVVKSEGAGAFGGRLDEGEAQALYSRAVGPYFNLQAGVRQDFRAAAPRTYATIGVEGLAPYWFELDAAAFLSTRGELTARLGAYYDQRVTDRLILQPRIDLNLAAQDVAAAGIGAGLSEAELGLRLRYEIAREFAPYVGVLWRRKAGRTADFARASGEDAGGAALVLGVRAWF